MGNKPTTDSPGADAGKEPASEPRNVAVSAHANHTKIGKAFVAAGPVDFPLTKSEAEALRDLGLVTITGIFTAQA